MAPCQDDAQTTWHEPGCATIHGDGQVDEWKRAWWRQYFPVSLILLLGFAISLAAFQALHNAERQRVEAEFARVANDRASVITKAISNNWLTLESARSLFATDDNVTRDEFRAFVQPFFSHMVGLQALEWVPRVPAARREEFRTAAQREGFKDYQIMERDSQGRLVSATRRAEYFPIYYVEPFQRNEGVLGYDLASDPQRRELLERTQQLGTVIATAPLVPSETADRQAVVLAILPVYLDGKRPGVATDGQKQLRGFILGVFHSSKIVEDALKPLNPSGVDVYVFQSPEPSSQNLAYYHPSRTRKGEISTPLAEEIAHPRGIFSVAKFKVGDQQWSLLMKPTVSFIAARTDWEAWRVLGGGVALTALLAGYVVAMAGRTRQIGRMVKQRTGQLIESEQRLRKLADCAHDAIIVMNQAGHIVFWNAAATRVFGHSAADALGKDMHTLLAPERYQEQYLRGLEQFRVTGQGAVLGKTMELEGIRRGGEEFPLELSVSTVIVDGQMHAIAVIRDITERKRAAEMLERAKREAESASRAKSEFLANMSHEIRTPMTAILGFVEVLSDTATDPTAKEAVDIIRRNGNHLLDVINNILDLSKIEAGKLPVEKMTCSVVGIVAEVASLMRVRAQSRNLGLLTEFTGPIPETIETDPTRLRQILINLLGNAIKFTEIGQVRLVTQLHEEPGQKPLLQFDVIDTGIGMTQEQAAHLFQPFTQADSSTSRRFGGTGLGLTISRRLAEMLGGTINAQSFFGQGTTFSVMIDPGPLDGVPTLDNPAEAALQSRPLRESRDEENPAIPHRVLLVEDGPDNQRLIACLLQKAGAEVVLAENGQVAIDKILAPPSVEGNQDQQFEPFDLILMDMQMPVLDGYEATRRLRAMGYTGPIIALTAHAMSQDRSRCLDIGCDDYLAKPVERQTLLEMVARFASRRAESNFDEAVLTDMSYDRPE